MNDGFWIIVLVIVCVTIVKIMKYRVHRAMKLPKCPPVYSDDARKQAKLLGGFLCGRKKNTGLLFFEGKDGTGISYIRSSRIFNGKDEGVVTLIRLCHYLGCEIVIRQIGYDDLENREDTPEILAEYIAKLEKE